MTKRSKRFLEALSKIDRTKRYTVEEAVDIIKGFPHANFDETVEVAVKLGVDPRQSDQLVRGSISLPNGLGRSVKVAVFAEGDAAHAAEEAGADYVGGADLVEKVQGGWMDFDVAIATPAMMRQVGRLGRILGPRGLMPSPKAGTVTNDVAPLVKEFKAGRVEFRTDSSGNVHVPVGKVSFSKEALVENIRAFLDHLVSLRPSAVRGVFVQKVAISSTMSPGVRISL